MVATSFTGTKIRALFALALLNLCISSAASSLPAEAGSHEDHGGAAAQAQNPIVVFETEKGTIELTVDMEYHATPDVDRCR